MIDSIHSGNEAVLEYAFFDSSLAQRFVDEAATHGAECRIADDPVAGWVAAIPDDLPEPVLDALDECYERLQQEQAVRATAEEGWVTKRLAGVQVVVADGSMRTVRLDGDTANRLLAAFTPEEAQALVQAIVRSLENPAEGPLCKALPS
jgi:hypothetical protein